MPALETAPERREVVMREKLENAPWWVWSMIMGVSFGAVMTVSNRLQQSRSWTAALVGGLIGGVFSVV